MRTRDAMKGQWKRMLVEFGVEESFLDKKHHPCPNNGKGEDRFRFTDLDGTGAYFCACSQGDKDGFGLLECKTGKSFKELAKEIDEIIGNKQEEWERREVTYAEQLRPVAKTTTRSAYLASRGLEVAPGLLWATDVKYNEDGEVAGRYAAMLGPIVRKGEWQTFHVTYLDKGKKAPVKCQRKILPGGSSSGGGVELYPAAEEMGVSEGIETAIAAKMLFDIPTHAAISTSGMAKWEPPSITKIVHIFADHDENLAGHAAAWTLAHRLKLLGVLPILHFPESHGDWNDVLVAQGKPQGEPATTAATSP